SYAIYCSLSLSADVDPLVLHSFPTRRSSDLPSQSQRALGANAARLVKGIPFKELEIREKEASKADTGQSFEIENITREQLKEIVDRKSTRLNSSHVSISYAVFCLKKKTKKAS